MSLKLTSRLAVLLLAFAWGSLTGCLVWTAPGDDDDATTDDDDATSDDDDATSDDDDATAPPLGLPVEQAAHGALSLVRFSGIEAGAIASAAFSDSVISPSAEEAGWQENSEVTLPTLSEPDGYRELLAGAYGGPFALQTSGISVLVADDSIEFDQQADGLWGRSDLAPQRLPFGSSWTAQFDGSGPFSGSHDGPTVPFLPVVSGVRLLGSTFYLSTGQGIEISADLPDSAEPDVFSLAGFGTPGRAWRVDDGTLSISAADFPSMEAEALFFFQRTHRRRVEVEGRSLVLVSGSWLLGQVVQLSAGDVFLRPLNPEPGDLVAGDILEFSPEPALANPALPYVLNINEVPHEATVVDGIVQITVQDPLSLGSGWRPVEMEIPGGFGRASIQIGAPAPGCDVDEFGENDVLGGANPLTAGQTLCGLTEVPGDEDYARFEATLGATYDLSVWAGRIGAAGDATLSLVDEGGNVLAFSDDQFGLDSHLRWTAPWSGTVFLRVAELNGSGGPDFFWRLSVRGAPTDP